MSKPGTAGGDRPPHLRMAPTDRIRTDIPTDRSRPTGRVRRPRRTGGTANANANANAMSVHGTRSARRSAAGVRTVRTVRTSEGSRR